VRVLGRRRVSFRRRGRALPMGAVGELSVGRQGRVAVVALAVAPAGPAGRFRLAPSPRPGDALAAFPFAHHPAEGKARVFIFSSSRLFATSAGGLSWSGAHLLQAVFLHHALHRGPGRGVKFSLSRRSSSSCANDGQAMNWRTAALSASLVALPPCRASPCHSPVIKCDKPTSLRSRRLLSIAFCGSILHGGHFA